VRCGDTGKSLKEKKGGKNSFCLLATERGGRKETEQHPGNIIRRNNVGRNNAPSISSHPGWKGKQNHAKEISMNHRLNRSSNNLKKWRRVNFTYAGGTSSGRIKIKNEDHICVGLGPSPGEGHHAGV